jgi:hypothetical protein
MPATGKVLRDTASIGLQGLGDGRTSDYLSHAVFASLFHQEPRYFYQGTGSNKSRLYHAVSNAWVARSDSGKKMPNYSYLLGTMVSGAISNAYYPHADQGANLVSKYNESGSIASQAVALPCKLEIALLTRRSQVGLLPGPPVIPEEIYIRQRKEQFRVSDEFKPVWTKLRFKLARS